MKKYILIGALVAIGLGFVALLTIEIPAPTEKVQREIPDDEFPS